MLHLIWWPHIAQWAKQGGQKELSENNKEKDFQLNYIETRIIKPEKDMSSQFRFLWR